MRAEATTETPFVAGGGCSGCPYRSTCHSARQRVQDAAIEVGRHYGCEFFRAINTKGRRVHNHRPTWWSRLRGIGS